MKRKRLFLGIAAVGLLLSACGGASTSSSSEEASSVDPVSNKYFTYEDISFVDKIGEKTNAEEHDYSSLKVNRLDKALREDFAFGVDASMTQAIEEAGGVYYNEQGQEQDVFQILRKSGVNFVRFRLWNKPSNIRRMNYGGGNNDAKLDLKLAKRAKAANLNVMLDFHYSDFWADPDHQQVPMEWGDLEQKDIPAKIEEFTKDTLQTFKDAGVTVDAVQIGNEINNGMCGYAINWNDTKTSYDVMSDMLKHGISGAKAVYPDIKTIVHLANGGNTEEFKSFYGALEERKVNYDIIGASYYPHLSGSLEDLKTNLDSVTKLTNKPAMVVETSWGFTDETAYVGEGEDKKQATINTYSSADEDIGGYLTGEQSQATCIRDIANTLANIDNGLGLGMFWWEPGWLPVLAQSSTKTGGQWATYAGESYQAVGDDSKRASYEAADADGLATLATWSNQGWFSYTGKALSSLKTYSYLKEGKNEVKETATKARKTELSYTLNLAAHETLPTTGKIETNLGAIRDAKIEWSAEAIEAVKSLGVHEGLTGVLNGQYPVTAKANCIQNYVVDPGFENQGTTDDLKDPWKIESVTPAGEKIVKLDRKKDIRSGKTDLNWFHSSEDFSFKISQTIDLPAGTYTLRTYILAVEFSKIPHTSLKLYMEKEDGTRLGELDICDADHLKGWSAGYQECAIKDINIPSQMKVKIGLEGSAKMGAWAHNDDWELLAQ